MLAQTIGIIGYGAIGSALHRMLLTHAPHLTVVAILERPHNLDDVRARAGETPVVGSWDEFLQRDPNIVVECAGHAALRAYGVLVLESGRSLIVSSVGALADHEIETALRGSASAIASLVIPSGAVGGLDALAAAKPAGIEEVLYTGRKLPLAWKGTAAEELIDLENVTEATVFFTGTAREAALKFPQNANVVAAVALAGAGFEATRVTLMADPEITGNCHTVSARGAFGEMSSRVVTKTLADNPKTSMLAPFSVMRAVVNLAGPIII